MERVRWLFAGFLSGCLMVSAGPCIADGAIALGVPGSVPKQGVAQGYSIRAKGVEDARRVALGYCGDAKKSSKAAAGLCKVVTVFQDLCVALVLDPKPGTPGYGWGLGLDKDAAGKAALEMCYDNAGADRHDFCKVTASDCDGSANK
jgi:uncharacterized protein DUF4189